jgi:hypothetical protein
MPDDVLRYAKILRSHWSPPGLFGNVVPLWMSSCVTLTVRGAESFDR